MKARKASLTRYPRKAVPGRRYPGVHEKVVDYISHSIEGATPCVNVCFKDGQTGRLLHPGETAYDAIYQLTGLTQEGVTAESYSYDLVGNRLSSVDAALYTYNSSNELVSTPTTTAVFA